MPENHNQLTALVLMRDGPEALLRLMSLCHRRGWTPSAVQYSTYDGGLAEAALRLHGPPSRCGPTQVGAQLARVVDVLDVVCGADGAVPDEVAVTRVRRRATWPRPAR